MNSLLLWIGGLLVAVLGLLFAVPHVIDWDAYRGVFEEEATRILGRDVRVGGKVNLRLLPSPYVRFEKVRISDAGAALGEPFFRAEAFTLWLSPTPLLRGAIEAHEVELDRPVLRLAVDAGGSGNWQQLRITPGALPFMPSDVVLQQVRIRDGVVSLRTPNATEPLTLSGIEGEVAAASLDGPYRFRGTVNWTGGPREIRINTSQLEPDGRLRFKTSVRALDTGNLYSVDGILSELSAKAQHTGVLTARLPLAGLTAEGSAKGRGTRSGEFIDLKANVSGDLDGMRLTDLTLGFEQNGKPQLISGEAATGWRNGLRMETRLASRWLDLDQIANTDGGSKAVPAEIVRNLISQVSAFLPIDGSSLLTVDVDQVNIGGESLSGVRLAMARAGGLTSIGELRASVPGNAKVELRGSLGTPASIDGQPGTPALAAAPANAFNGEIVLRGTSYRRFLAWAGATALLQPNEAGDAPFSLVSQLRVLPDGLTVTNANVELGSRVLGGSADWRWGRERQLEINVEGHTVDIGAFAPGVLDFTALQLNRPASAASQQATSAASQSIDSTTAANDTGSTLLATLASRAREIERAVGGLRLKIRAHTLSDGTTTLNDVDADVSLRGDRLAISGLKVASTTAASFDVRGELSALSSQPQGNLRGWINAGSSQGIATLASLLPTGARSLAGPWLTHASNADLGFVLKLDGGPSGRATINIDGILDDARLAFDLKLDGGLVRWREAPIDLAMTLEGVSAGEAVRRIANERIVNLAGTRSVGPASLRITSAGASAAALITLATLETRAPAGSTRAVFDGRASVDGAGAFASGGVALSGNIAVEAPDAGDLLLLAGVSRRPLIAGAPVRGTLRVERKAGVTNFAAGNLDVGGSRLAGNVALTAKGDRTRIEGQLSASRIALLGLFGLILDGEAQAAGAAVNSGGEDTPSPWPDTSLSLALLDGIEGQITLSTPTAVLADGLELTNAEMSIGLSPGRLSIASLTGAALGGRFTARSTVEAAPAGANLSIDARMTGARLALLGGGRADAQRNLGEGNFSVTLSGRATSLRAAMSQLTGKGEIELRNGRIEGLGAELIEKTALAVFEGGEGVTRATLQGLIGAERARSALGVGNRKLPVEVADGVARIGTLEIATPEATLRNTTTVDLAALKADSDWRIVPRRALPGTSGGSRRDALPAVAVVWTGPLAGIARTEPRLSLDALERELAIRKMEHDAEKLEELRRQDEDRARQETERLKQIEEAARAPAQAPISGDAPVTAPSIQAPLPTVTRPPPRPAPPSRDGSRTLLDALMGQQ